MSKLTTVSKIESISAKASGLDFEKAITLAEQFKADLITLNRFNHRKVIAAENNKALSDVFESIGEFDKEFGKQVLALSSKGEIYVTGTTEPSSNDVNGHDHFSYCIDFGGFKVSLGHQLHHDHCGWSLEEFCVQDVSTPKGDSDKQVEEFKRYSAILDDVFNGFGEEIVRSTAFNNDGQLAEYECIGDISFQNVSLLEEILSLTKR